MTPKVVLAVLSLGLGTAAFQHPPTSRMATRLQATGLSLLRDNNDAEVAAECGNDASHLMDMASSTRRDFFARSIAASAIAGSSVFSFASPSFAADATKLEPYDDLDYGFRVQIPTSWETTQQKLSGRRKGIFFTDPNSKDAETGTIETLGFIAYTPLRDDFTGLSSFGSVDEVAQTTILPKGELAGNPEDSKMLEAISKNSAYYFDYVATPVVPTQPGSGAAMTKTLKQQHFRTIFTLLPLKNASGLTLVTVTLQTTEARYGDLKGIFDSVIDSFGKTSN